LLLKQGITLDIFKKCYWSAKVLKLETDLQEVLKGGVKDVISKNKRVS